jgi:hypothetical protein
MCLSKYKSRSSQGRELPYGRWGQVTPVKAMKFYIKLKCTNGCLIIEIDPSDS